MHCSRFLVKCSTKQWRAFSRCCTLNNTSTQPQTQSQTAPVTDVPPTSAAEVPLKVPQPEGEAKVFSPKIEGLVNEIAKLTLLEVGELSELLKKKLNLPDAPLMPMGGFAPVAQAAPAEEEEEVAAKVQTSFTLKMLKFDDKQKVALIKEVKNLLEGMNLVQAKKFVESAPVVVKADIPKDEAEKLKEAFAKVGAECVVE